MENRPLFWNMLQATNSEWVFLPKQWGLSVWTLNILSLYCHQFNPGQKGFVSHCILFLFTFCTFWIGVYAMFSFTDEQWQGIITSLKSQKTPKYSHICVFYNSSNLLCKFWLSAWNGSFQIIGRTKLLCPHFTVLCWNEK